MKKLLSKRVINQTTRKKQSVKMTSVIVALLLSMLSATSVHAQDESGAVHAEDWKGMDISSLTTGGTYFEAPINQAALNELKNKGLRFQGVGFTLVSVDLVKSDGTYSSLYSQETVFDDWNDTFTIPASKFSGAVVGDKIRCIYKDRLDNYNPVFKYVESWGDFDALQNNKTEGTLSSSTEEVYIYNVETGKFMYIGGDWGVKPELQYRDFGLKFRMEKDGDRYVFTSDVYTLGGGDTNGNYLGLMQGYNGNNVVNNGITVDKRKATLDGYNSDNELMYCYSRFNIERVSGEDGDTYTYVLSLTPKEYSKEYYEVKKGNQNDWNKLPDLNTHYYLEVKDGLSVVETTDATKTGHWRFVPISVIDAAVRDMAQNSVDAFNGMNLDITYNIDNQGFNRNNQNNWELANGADYLKYKVDGNYALETPAINGKYYYGLMKQSGEGGMIYRSFTAPAAGWYKVQCQGVSKSGLGQLFALVDNEAPTPSPVYAPLNKVESVDSYSSITSDGRIALGKAFYNNQYPVEAYFHAEAGQYVMIGIQQWGTGYDVNNDLTAFDNFQIKYLGDIFVLNEDYTECTEENEYTKGKNGATVILRRTFSKKDDGSYYWNTLTLPISLTGAQVKEAFGDNVKLAIATGLDQNDPYLITFRTEDAAKGIKEGQFYLIKPAKEPDTPVGQEKVINGKTYTGPLYTLGRRDVPEISNEVFGDGHSFWDPFDPNEHNSILYQGTYLKRENGVPERSYVFSKGDMYHTKTPQTIKGFRFWIEDHWNKGGSAKPFTLSIGGVEDQQEAGQIITTISEVEAVTSDNAAVYSLSGQFLGKGKQLLNSLPKGIYVVNNKKYMVK